MFCTFFVNNGGGTSPSPTGTVDAGRCLALRRRKAMNYWFTATLIALALSGAGCETSPESSGGELGSDIRVGADSTHQGPLCGDYPADDPRSCVAPGGDADTSSPVDITSAGDSFALTNNGDCPASGCRLELQQDGLWLCYGWNDGLEYFGAPTDNPTARSYCDGTWYEKNG